MWKRTFHIVGYSPISSKHDSIYHRLCGTSREIAQWVHHEGSIRRPMIPPWLNILPHYRNVDVKISKYSKFMLNCFWNLHSEDSVLDISLLCYYLYVIRWILYLYFVIMVDNRLLSVAQKRDFYLDWCSTQIKSERQNSYHSEKSYLSSTRQSRREVLAKWYRFHDLTSA